MSIIIKGITKLYGAQKAVNNLSFSVNKGEIVGFLGPNGAGKSTTMKMITGYLVPDQGEATVCGINVLMNPLEVKRKIGYLSEANPLYYEMYVKEYLDFIAGIHKVKNCKWKIDEVIELTGLSIEQKKKIGQLSKGYKQRTGLAAALIHDPEVLILDEPTSGLDPNQIIEIRNVIRDQGKNKTVLFSSHILQEVQALCDRVIIINKGNLVADDKLQNLQKSGSTNVIKVSFSEKIEKEKLAQIAGLSAVIQIDNNSWQIKGDNTNSIKKQLMELSLKQGLNIVSLQTEGDSLEEIFRTLTTNEKTT